MIYTEIIEMIMEKSGLKEIDSHVYMMRETLRYYKILFLSSLHYMYEV